MNRHEQALLKAQSTVEKNKKFVKRYAKKRQWYHFMPECGWMNDPNGLIYYKGKYHLFYQFYPYGPYWSAMHWGHAISDDLLNWEYLPVALAPSEPYDDCQKGGIFSGSAVTGKDGRLYLFYTGTVISDDKVIKSQCMAVSEDGINFTKYQNNPIIDPTMFVESDPKVWYKENKWYMIVGGEENHKGRAILYVSDDLEKWSYFGTILKSDGSLGAMWECPDLFSVDGSDIMVICPMHLGEQKCSYLVGNMDYKNRVFIPSAKGEVDYGFDYYAPQSFEDPKGRRIQFAWANAWDWMPWWKGFGTTAQEKWCGAMNIPREIRIKNNIPRFIPIKELSSLRENHRYYDKFYIDKDAKTKINAGDGIHCEILATLSLTDTSAESVIFKLRSADDVQGKNNRFTKIIFNLCSKTLSVDRNYSDDWSTGIKSCKLRFLDKDKLLIHIFMDTVSVEVFTDDYATAFSTNIYPEEICKDIYVETDGGSASFLSFETWGIKQVSF